ncbi:ankyrin repeat-containing domain protein, partial [Kalaharituber pfeilii]
DIIALLIARTANIDDASGPRGTALCEACYYGNVPLTRALLRANAAVDIAATRWGNALHCAAENGNTHLIDLLLAHAPSNPVAYINTPGGRFSRALYAAAFHGHEDAARVLSSRGA